MRALGVQYVVVHGDRLAREDRGIIEAAKANPLCRLVARIDSDYLFEVLSEDAVRVVDVSRKAAILEPGSISLRRHKGRVPCG